MTRKELAEIDKKITEWSHSEAAEKLRAEKRAAGLPTTGYCWWMPQSYLKRFRESR